MEDITSLTGWVGLLVLGGGLYCLFACVQMKLKGIINENILLNKDARGKKCKDKAGYIKEIFPTFLIFSLTTTFCGVVDMINTYVTSAEILYLISLVLFIVGFILFMVKSKKCKDKYF